MFAQADMGRFFFPLGQLSVCQRTILPLDLVVYVIKWIFIDPSSRDVLLGIVCHGDALSPFLPEHVSYLFYQPITTKCRISTH